jgi:hypothetical protein
MAQDNNIIGIMGVKTHHEAFKIPNKQFVEWCCYKHAEESCEKQNRERQKKVSKNE